jgi:hypothetical protein
MQVTPGGIVYHVDVACWRRRAELLRNAEQRLAVLSFLDG